MIISDFPVLEAHGVGFVSHVVSYDTCYCSGLDGHSVVGTHPPSFRGFPNSSRTTLSMQTEDGVQLAA